MTSRDQEALRDILGVMDRALGFPIADFDALERTVLTGFGDYKPEELALLAGRGQGRQLTVHRAALLNRIKHRTAGQQPQAAADG